MKELENPVRDEDSGLERGIHNPSLEKVEPVVALDAGSNERPAALRPSKPKVGNFWQRMRDLGSQLDVSKLEPVSPKALITKNGQRLRVADPSATAPLR